MVSNVAGAEEVPQRAKDDSDQGPWYSTSPPNIRPKTRQLLETYSKIPQEDVLSHVTTFRDKAWKVHPYPCIGEWRFLDLPISMHSLYPELLERLRDTDQLYVDMGCALGGDTRCVIADGVLSSRCYGVDNASDFIELGFDFFRDRGFTEATYIVADIFHTGGSSPLDALDGRIDVLSASSFFHLMSMEQQKVAARRILRLMKPTSGSIIVGRHMANDNAGEHPSKIDPGMAFRHNEQSWEAFWHALADEMGIKLKVTTKRDDTAVRSMAKPEIDPGTFRLEYAVQRL